MSSYDEEYLQILGNHTEVKIDGGTIIHEQLNNGDLPNKPPKKIPFRCRMIEALKKLGIKVTHIDPVTFIERDI